MAELGRPTVMTEKVIEKIEEVLEDGGTLAHAALLANISLKTIYNYFEINSDFKERCDLLQNMIAFQARKNIKAKIEANDIETSKYWLDRKDKEFKPKSDLTSDDKPLPILNVSADNGDNKNSSTTQED